MTENGPRTHELVGEVETLREQMREDRHESNTRLTELETKMKLIVALGSIFATGIMSLIVLVTIGVLNP